MTGAARRDDLWIVGAGRMGLALALLLREADEWNDIRVIGRRANLPDHPLFVGDPPAARYQPAIPTPDPAPAAVLLAVPDDALAVVAQQLADVGIGPETTVLHLSGALGLEPLKPLAARGCPVGGLHPWRAVADRVTDAAVLRGAWFGVQGKGAARDLAERIVGIAGGRVLPVSAESKPLYHAAAVLASNCVVALLAAAERLMLRAGVPAGEARAALTDLATGAVADVAAHGPAAALTGPIARGDAATVRLHLARLSGRERALYSVLGRETLQLARERGLGADRADAIEQILAEDG